MPEQIALVDESEIETGWNESAGLTVQWVVNSMLNEKVDELVGAVRYERTADLEAYRFGHYSSNSQQIVARQTTIRLP